MAKLLEVTDATFDTDVLQANGPTLVDFGADWCGPCKMIAPAIEAVAKEYGDKLHVVQMDVDANPDTPRKLGIMGIPTLIVFKGGEEVARIVGYRPKDALVQELLPHIE